MYFFIILQLRNNKPHHCFTAPSVTPSSNSATLIGYGPDFTMNTPTSTPQTTATTKIERFKGQNFSQWKFRVQLLLQKLKVFDIINGTLPEPEAEDKEKLSEHEEQLKANWEEKDIIAREAIVMCIADSHLAEVQDLRTAQEMWNALCGRYERNTASKTYFLRKLINLKMQEGTAVGDHLNSTTDIISKLSALKAPLKEEYIIAILLNSLPPSWENFVSIHEANDRLTLETLKSKMLQQELRQKEGKSDIAFLAHHKRHDGHQRPPSSGRPFRRPNHPHNSKKVYCAFCKQWCHHTEAECRKKQSSLKNRSAQPELKVAVPMHS